MNIKANMASSMAEVKANLWYARRGSRICGPYPAGLVSRYILLGRISVNDELSPDQREWTPVSNLPELIPEEMQQLDTDEDYQRLIAARLREDERSGQDRRMGESAEEAARHERRQGDRRQPEDPELVAFRAQRLQALENTGTRDSGGQRRLGYLLLGLMVVTGLVIWGTPEQEMVSSDCTAEPAPGIRWSNCRLPGLQAEQADLTDADARNMDLTGARLTAVRFDRADLAYTLLNLADLRHASLQQAHMTGVGLREADLRNADLTGADLGYADLRSARIEGADFTAARLGRAIWIDGRECAADSVGQCLPVSTQP